MHRVEEAAYVGLYEDVDTLLLEPIFPPNPKRQKLVKQLNLLNKPFGLEFFLRGHTRAREGEGFGELDVSAVQ